MTSYRLLSCLWRSSSLLRSGLNPLAVTSAATPRLLSTRVELDQLPKSVRQFVEENARLCNPDDIHVCDGSEEENREILDKLQSEGRLVKLTKPGYENCYLARTSQADVARVESRTYICTDKEEDTIPPTRDGVRSKLGNWMQPTKMDNKLEQLFSGCMKGRTMYVLPFSMGPYGSPLSKIGIQLTDSEYVVASMRIMTRMGKRALDTMEKGEFTKCLHSIGYPLERKEDDVKWPCNPDNITIAHFPERNEIKSFGSGYGGNSLLGKKCFALRIASTLAKKQGWLAEHMLILGITNPEGRKKYIAAAFPSACGKTNLAMMTPTLPGWKVECVGDDIAWMKFDKDGRLRAINPEYGFFGVAPGTNYSSNPNAMESIKKNTIFTNVAHTSDGGVYWKDMEEPADDVTIESWLGKENWESLKDVEKKMKPAAHPNSRFCAPASNCPIIDPLWEDPEGVPIDAILFGGRRPRTIPLVYEAFSWQHGVFVGASMRSEATSAAEHSNGGVMHDPFAMRPFFGYSFAKYMEHWLSLEKRPNAKLPKIFHVNWFRRNAEGGFLWPGFGENSRVLDWVFRRCDGDDIAQSSPIGLIPTPDSLNLKGLKEKVDIKALFRLPKEELEEEVKGIAQYFDEQLPESVPKQVNQELQALKERISRI